MNPIILVGHRATGKTTLGQRLSKLEPGWRVIDLDAEIEAQTGQTCADLVTIDVQHFRQIEQSTLQNLIQTAHAHTTQTIIVPGAGSLHLPLGPIYLWLYRDGWQEDAKTQRKRLRPELTWSQEVQWMQQTREPVWANAAHLKHHIQRADLPEHTAQDIHTLIRWTTGARHSDTANKTYIVPTNHKALPRAISDVQTLGVKGIELRSDFFDIKPDHCDVPVILSLRHDQPNWLQNTLKQVAYDIDIHHLDAVLAQKTLHALNPTMLLLSHHPPTHNADTLEQLTSGYDRLVQSHPEWRSHVVLKYAPTLESILDFPRLLETVNHQQSPAPLTLLPQGTHMAWARPWLISQGNVTNYLPVGCLSKNNDAPTPYDYQAWLPHLTMPQPTSFDALLGHPVEQSIGDVWHRRHNLQNEGVRHRSYLKIPIHPKTTQTQWQTILKHLMTLGLRGISVTSPFKRLTPQATSLENPHNLNAANTIRLQPNAAITDTDAKGLLTTLAYIEAQGFAPGDIAMIGHGGVSPAMVRAIEHSAWTLTLHAQARKGWPQHTTPVTLIINASGNTKSAYTQPPECKVWLDLHYKDIQQPPPCTLHLNGRLFFDAQARGQQDFWAMTPSL